MIYELSRHLRALDPTRLVHYEGIANDPRYPETSDMVSRMYTPVSEIRTYLANRREKPFIMCEYSHAMGNSCGAMQQMGVGGDDSWGARTHEEYLIDVSRRLTFSFCFRGIV